MRKFVRHPLGIVGIYLVAVSPPLILMPWSWGHALLSLVHVAACVVCLQLARSRGTASWPTLWFAVVLIPLLYSEVALLNQALGTGYQDPLVAAWENAIFGSPATDLAGRYPSALLSEILHSFYLAFYPMIYLPPLLLFLAGRREAFHTTTVLLLTAATVCFTIFVYFPVQGPRYFGPPEGVPDGRMRWLALTIAEAGSSRGAAFPSSHIAIMICQALAALRYQRRVGWVVTTIAIGVGLGAVYGGFHYAIDMVAGALVGILVGAAVLRLRPPQPAADPA